MKNLRVLMIAVLVLGLTGVMMAEDGEADPEPETIGGTIPFNAQWTFTDVDQTTKIADLTASEDEYETGSISIDNIQQCTNLDANDSLSVAAKISTWTLPDDYPTNGNKTTVDATSDFQILVNDFVESPRLEVSGDFNDATYTLLTSDDQDIFHSTSTPADNVGVENEEFGIDCQIPLDWVTDCPGAYAITMTLTLSQIAE
ncbi:MAG: hypothetical protein P9L97_13060 [Candidatus Tenebribacter davisii]|nr:hypothetical protein [Candidatus Tenebribacter davisii]